MFPLLYKSFVALVNKVTPKDYNVRIWGRTMYCVFAKRGKSDCPAYQRMVGNHVLRNPILGEQIVELDGAHRQICVSQMLFAGHLEYYRLLT